MAKTKTTYYYKEYELETQKLNQLSENSFQVLLKFNEKNSNNIGKLLSVKALFNNLGDQVFDIEVKSSIFGRGSDSQNGVFNLKLRIEEEDKANLFSLMAKVFNSVKTTNLFTTIQQYSELPSNTFSMKLFGSNKASTTTSKIFKVIGLETIATSDDGVNYTLKGATTIKSDESLTIPSGKYMNFNKPFTNNGEVNIGNGKGRKSAKDTTDDDLCSIISSNQTNSGTYTIKKGECLTIDTGVTWTNDNTINNLGTITIDGTLLNTDNVFNGIEQISTAIITINQNGLLSNNVSKSSDCECNTDNFNGILESYATINGDGYFKECSGYYSYELGSLDASVNIETCSVCTCTTTTEWS